MFWVFVDPH